MARTLRPTSRTTRTIGVAAAACLAAGTVTVTGVAQAATETGLSAGQQEAPSRAHYTVSLRSNERGDQWRGEQAIRFTNTSRDTLRTIWVRLWNNGFLGCEEPLPIRVSDVRGGTAGPLDVDCTALPITLRRPLRPHATARISFDVAIDVPERNDRFGRIGDFSYLGNALPVLAVYDEDGWNLPPYVALKPTEFGESFYSLTSDFRVTLNHPEELSVPASGVAVRERTRDGWTRTVVRAPRVRDFMWAAGPFAHTSTRTDNGVAIRTWWTPEITQAEVVDTQDVAKRSVEFFSREYGRYSYPEMDTVVSSFTSFGGMEYPNLILTQPSAGPAAHEAGHQWFYSMIGNDEYEHPWLDESVTSYLTAKFFGGTGEDCSSDDFPSANARIDGTMDYFRPRPNEYILTIYVQGPCMLHALEDLIGSENLRAAMREMYGRYALDVIRPDDFRSIVAQHTDVDLDPFWEEWRNTGSGS